MPESDNPQSRNSDLKQPASRSDNCILLPFKQLYRIVAWEPQPNQKVPWYYFFKNRWFRGVVYLIACIATTLIYYGWQHFSFMLMRHGVYRWRCTEAELEEMGPDDACDSQRSALRTLFFVGTSSEFVLGVLAGLSFDHVGPVLTVIFGYLCFFLGWIFLVVSHKGVQLYIPAMILMAGSTNLIAFPALCLQDFFPSRAGLAASLVVAAQTMGTMVTPVMWSTWNLNPTWSFGQLVGGYLGFVVTPICITYALCLPILRPALRKSDPEIISSNTAEQEVLHVTQLDSATLPCKKPDDTTTSTTTTSEDVQNTEVHLPVSTDDASLLPTAKNVSYGVLITAAEHEIASHRPKELSIWKQLSTLDYILFTVSYVLPLFNYGYYSSILEERSGRNVANFQGIILPTQGVFGALFGLVVDYVKTIPICYVLSGTVLMMYAFLLTEPLALHYIAAVLFVISNSFIYTVKYTYVQEMYPPRHFGFLAGLMGCVAGAITLLNIVIETMDFRAAVILNMCFAGATIALLVFLHIRQLRGIQYKGIPTTSPK